MKDKGLEEREEAKERKGPAQKRVEKIKDGRVLQYHLCREVGSQRIWLGLKKGGPR